jgi:hypothetical protein
MPLTQNSYKSGILPKDISSSQSDILIKFLAFVSNENFEKTVLRITLCLAPPPLTWMMINYHPTTNNVAISAKTKGDLAISIRSTAPPQAYVLIFEYSHNTDAPGIIRNYTCHSIRISIRRSPRSSTRCSFRGSTQR